MWFPTLLGAATLLATTVLADEPAMDVSYDVKEDLLPLEVALGLDTGVGVRCAEGHPRGEDLVEYCRPLTPQERLRLNRTATSEYWRLPSLCLSVALPFSLFRCVIRLHFLFNNVFFPIARSFFYIIIATVL